MFVYPVQNVSAPNTLPSVQCDTVGSHGGSAWDWGYNSAASVCLACMKHRVISQTSLKPSWRWKQKEQKFNVRQLVSTDAIET